MPLAVGDRPILRHYTRNVRKNLWRPRMQTRTRSPPLTAGVARWKNRGAVNLFTHILIYIRSLFSRGFGQEFVFVSAPVLDSRNWNSRSNRFVLPPSSGGGSNAPRPALSVPHLDGNAGGCRARQARSRKNIACRGWIPEILVLSSRLQRLDALQIWHHFQTVVASIVVFWIVRWHTLERLFCLTYAGLER